MFKYLFLVFILSVACSVKENFEQEIGIEVSREKKIDFATLGLSSNLLFPPACFDEKSNSLIVFNSFKHSIDSLKFTRDTVLVKKGVGFEKEGPNGVPAIGALILSERNYYLFSEKLMSKVVADSTVIDRIYLNKVPGLANYSTLSYRALTNYEFDHFIRSFDGDKNLLYMVAKDLDTRKLIFGRLHLDEKSFEELPILFDSALIRRHEILFDKAGYVYNNNLPYVVFEDGKLIISYYFSSKISIVDLKDWKVSEIPVRTIDYPEQKRLPQKSLASMSAAGAMEEIENWEKDVAYGQIFRIPNSNRYFRIVKGDSDILKANYYELFLEIFDQNLNKIFESNISEIQPDLASFYFPLEDVIFFKSKNQYDEGVLNYYLLQIDESNAGHL